MVKNSNENSNEKSGKKSNKKFMVAVITMLAFGINFFSTFIGYCENNRTVIPIGKTIGMILNMKHPTIADISEVVERNGGRCCPAKNAGIKCGDRIKKLNGMEIKTREDVVDVLDCCCGEQIEIVIDRNGKEIVTNINPCVSANDNKYKLGMWINDYASGIGTLTFYDPENNKFGALGHAIVDNASGNVFNISGGNIF